ncbi:MAG: MoaD/ThiS family protein [Gemmatimonadota bacterium]|nr:MoaD/ThiS family protein [Gemmatimonadota bacterium]MDP6529752.1 MoaD/ThiS family protein [Gemmatimonadota bacterium]
MRGFAPILGGASAEGPVPDQELTIRLHAHAADLAGVREIRAPGGAGDTAKDVKDALARVCPPLAPLLPSCVLATDSEYLPDSGVVEGDRTLHLIPPVSGG